MRDYDAKKNNKKLPMLQHNYKLNKTIICLNHYWRCEKRHVNEKVMQSVVKDVRGTRTYGSAALEFAHVAEGIIGTYLTMRLVLWEIAAGNILVKEEGSVLRKVSDAVS